MGRDASWVLGVLMMFSSLVWVVVRRHVLYNHSSHFTNTNTKITLCLTTDKKSSSQRGGIHTLETEECGGCKPLLDCQLPGLMSTLGK